jgi:hypothetical protein
MAEATSVWRQGFSGIDVRWMGHWMYGGRTHHGILECRRAAEPTTKGGRRRQPGVIISACYNLDK